MQMPSLAGGRLVLVLVAQISIHHSRHSSFVTRHSSLILHPSFVLLYICISSSSPSSKTGAHGRRGNECPTPSGALFRFMQVQKDWGDISTRLSPSGALIGQWREIKGAQGGRLALC